MTHLKRIIFIQIYLSVAGVENYLCYDNYKKNQILIGDNYKFVLNVR